MSKTPSIISGKSQPIKKISIDGDVFDGICATCFKVFFENKRDDPIEISFSSPLPIGVAATHFDIEYAGKKVTSRISDKEDAKLEYDDAIASSEFAAIVQSTSTNELRIDIGPLGPTENCILSLYYDIGMTALSDGFLLILPTAISDSKDILCLGLNPPPIELNLHIKDSQKIEQITTPFTETKIDLPNGLVTSSDLKLFHPFHVVIKYQEPLVARCLVSTINNNSYIRFSATSPNGIRQHSSVFSLLVEHSANVTPNEFSILLRALEFFMISLPTDCPVNVYNYGKYNNSMFETPAVLDTNEMRTKALNFSRNPIPKEEAHTTLQEIINKSTEKVKDLQQEKVLIIIGAPCEEQLTLPEDSIVIMVDPFSQGNIEEISKRNNAIYLPVPDEQSLVGALLSVINITGCGLIGDCKLVVDGNEIPISPLIPGMAFSLSHKVQSPKIEKVEFYYGNEIFVNAVISHTDNPAVRTIWALQEYIGNSEDEDVINAIMTPDRPCVAVIERDEEMEGDITLVQTKMSSVGLQWEEKTLKKGEPQPNPVPLPRPMPYPPFHTMPYVYPVNGRTINQRNLDPSAIIQLDHFDEHPELPSDRVIIHPPPPPKKDEEKPQEKYEIKKIDYQKMLNEENKRRKEALERTISSKKPFFLLKLLQIQNADGSWSDKNKLKICCGFDIPETPTIDVPNEVFLTIFVICCLHLRGMKDVQLWELAVKKSFLFLQKFDANRNWEEDIEKLMNNMK
ncbi:hypothetical protein TVAG_303360 [Trichomonas vaginalis G3]|uniref:VIT domain-containing protein n=1 Tax=Trichomonas vaginalis (strain ATCC PRA-98 / G3) TaxID=412133 RepID=A2DR18_TRIV3|nr:von Willebrand factor A domain-containing protein 5A family [Trichomonas vaginalis G3]EAY17117.1 hypothetical protein TVAG_303360 [Trichomonas vaginalis G3]KAI5508827.1 von Willebrand factor A domain-containing protein 5A family [Trichomonas vaginalis G3]|eukprot:XP_001329340.1 hypothetical protein [Trichomonas vaginalis G3]